MSITRGTVHSIQFLRFVAAMLVVVFHAHLAFTTKLPVAHAPGSDYWFRFGAVGVHIFFVISGYIMYLTNFTRDEPFGTRRFFARRLIRIYPTYWTFVALYLAVEAVLRIAPVMTGLQFSGMLALSPADAPRVIGPAWTLSYEIFFYLAFGLVMRLGAGRGAIALTALFVLAVGAGALIRPTAPAAMLATNALLLEFVAGLWIARLTTIVAWPRPLGWAALAGGTAGFAVGLAWGYDRLPSALAWGGPGALLVAGAVILEQTAAFGERRGPVRWLSVLGDSSYSLYLCHILLVTLIVTAVRAAGWVPPMALLVAGTALVCLAFAELFYRHVERPMVRMLHRLTERRRELAGRGAGDPYGNRTRVSAVKGPRPNR